MEGLLRVAKDLIAVVAEVSPASKEKLSTLDGQILGIQKKLEGDAADAGARLLRRRESECN